MPRTDLTRRVVTGPKNTTTPLNGALFQTVASADGAQFDLTGGEILVWRNTAATPVTLTFVGTADDFGRSESQTVAVAGTIGHTGAWRFSASGWRQATGKCHIDVSANGLEMMLLA